MPTGSERADVYVEESVSWAKSPAAQSFQRWPRAQGCGLRRLRRKETGCGGGQGQRAGGAGSLRPRRVPPPVGSRVGECLPEAGGSSTVGKACARKLAGSVSTFSFCLF